MMHEFLSSQRAELIARCRVKVAQRAAPQATPAELEHGIPVFLDQLITTLRLEQTSRPVDSRKVSGAVAVTEFNCQRESATSERHASAMDEQLGSFAHELRNLLNTATLAFGALKMGNVGVTGATGCVLEKSLVGLRNLIDRSLSAVRMTPGMQVQHQVFSLADFVAEVRVIASLEANVRGCPFASAVVDPELAVAADRDLLLSAVGNLLQSAFKFTHRHTTVTLSAYAVPDACSQLSFRVTQYP